MQPPETKPALRKKMLALRRSMDSQAREKADAAIRSNLKGMPELSGSRPVAAYLSDGFEPDLSELLDWLFKDGRRVFLPRSGAGGSYSFAEIEGVEGRLVEGPFGIMEPAASLPEASEGDLKESVWLVPGVAFDAAGGRLGRGKGVYDRLLAEGCGFSIGVFYEFQICAELPVERHDFRLDAIVTEAGVRRRAA